MGGSDAIADTRFYLYNSAAVVVIDKSGAANWLSQLFEFRLRQVFLAITKFQQKKFSTLI